MFVFTLLGSTRCSMLPQILHPFTIWEASGAAPIHVDTLGAMAQVKDTLLLLVDDQVAFLRAAYEIRVCRLILPRVGLGQVQGGVTYIIHSLWSERK